MVNWRIDPVGHFILPVKSQPFFSFSFFFLMDCGFYNSEMGLGNQNNQKTMDIGKTVTFAMEDGACIELP